MQTCACGEQYDAAKNFDDVTNPHGHLDARFHVNGGTVQTSYGVKASYGEYSVFITLDNDDAIQGYKAGKYVVGNVPIDGDDTCWAAVVADIVDSVEDGAISMAPVEE